MDVAKLWLTRASAGVRMFAILALMITGFQVGTVTAQDEPDASTDAESVDISLITRDPDDGHLLMDSCYELVDYSNEGCDENSDGQVTFADIPFGTYTVHQTQAPDGYPTINDYEIEVQPSAYFEGPPVAVPVGFIVKQAPEQNAPDTRNVSVITVDMNTHEKIVTDVCVELVGASNMGCDEDLRDGQIDFLDVPAGGPYELSFDLPDGYQVATVGGPLAVEIDASPESPANTIIFAMLFTPEGTGEQGSALLDITLRGCPDGVVPQNVAHAIECTVPLDAPETAGVYWGGDGQGGLPMSDVERLYDGTYRALVPAGMPVSLINFEPSVRNAFMAVGTDGVDNGGDPVITLSPTQLGHVYIYYYFETSVEGSSAPSQETWTASVQVMNCDSAPGMGVEPNCHAQGGIEVNIALPDGEYLGMCAVSEPYATPWGTDISTCNVPGMPFNQEIMAFQDYTTIPAGYEPVEEVLYLSVGDLIPGGGDQATFTFINVLTNSGSSGSTDAPVASGATLAMTMRGCPEGFDPNTGDFWAECTIPLDAPDNAIIIWGGDGQGGMEIAFLDRQYNGAYIYGAGPHTMNLQITGLAPAVRDGYQVFGFDSVSGEYYTINLIDGETREVFVFYWFD